MEIYQIVARVKLITVLVLTLFIYFFSYLYYFFTFYMYNLACMCGNFSSLCLVTEIFALINMYVICVHSKCFFFSDLLTIDEKLFSSNCPPLDALPLYLSHFQFIETSSEDKVKLSLDYLVSTSL